MVRSQVHLQRQRANSESVGLVRVHGYCVRGGHRILVHSWPSGKGCRYDRGLRERGRKYIDDVSSDCIATILQSCLGGHRDAEGFGAYYRGCTCITGKRLNRGVGSV
jgi:hypothetical protein